MYENKSFRQLEERDFLKKAFKKATGTIEQDRIKIEDLNDLYGTKTIEADKVYVEKREKQFKDDMNDENRRNSELATVFEAILYEHGEQSDWFGKSAITMKTSKFDDIANGVDEIVEFIKETSSSYLALAVDATYSVKFSESKLQKIKEEIDRGKLATVKYAILEKTGFRGELTRVPRIVIGVSARTVKELGELWLSKNNKALANHPVQMQILEEILMQARVFGKYAESTGKIEIAKKYKNIEMIIKDVITEKIKQNSSLAKGDRDDVFRSLEMALHHITK